MTKKLKRPVAFLSAFAMVMAMLLYFPGETFRNIDWGLTVFAEGYDENGFGSGEDPYQPATLTTYDIDNDGTSDDVYEIGNAGQLYWFADKVNNENATYGSANAVLTADITVNEGVLNPDGTLADGTSEFKIWTPIGNDPNMYTGTFNGINHTISGLYFNNSSDTYYVGLFGWNSGTVKNVGVVDSYFNGYFYVGGVCGYTDGGTIKNCYNTGAVSGSSYVGGVCGGNSGTITNCYNTGEVSCSGHVGGVCGGNFGTITNCYNTGAVSGSSYAGGVCGYTDSGTITNCYFDSTIYNNGKAVGINDGGTVSEDVLGKETTQFNNGEVAYLLSQGENGSVWGQTIGTDSYPVLGGAKVYYEANISFYSNYQSAVYNATDACYEISSADQLYWFADCVNRGNTSVNAVLTADITVNKDVLKPDGTLNSGSFTSWTPIGIDESKAYDGTFDGKNYTISGLYFNDTNTDSVGLFGSLHGTVKNVGVVDSYISGKYYVGGVCAINEGGTITNCYNTGSVSCNEGFSRYIGGVCGQNAGGTIQNCYNTGSVSGYEYIGGVCGQNAGGTIQNCYYDSDKYSGNAIGVDSGTATNVEGKATKQFNKGEVAFLLSQGCKIGETTYDGSVWGQTLTGDNKQDYPVLGGKMVLTNSDQSAFANDIIIYGQSVTLDGTIGMNIYVAADDDYTDWTASFNDKAVATPEKDENGLYKFTYQVAAKDMEQEIVFSINGEEKAKVSVKTYLDALDTADDTKLANLADAMKTYGNAASEFFKGESVAAVEGVTAADLESYGFTKGTAPEGITYYGSSLILESETTIRHYFTIADGYSADSFTFGAGNEPGKPVAKQGYYYVDIKNISAEKLGDAFSVSVNGDAVISNYSALSYAKKVLDSEETDDNLKNLVKALYLYNQNAIAYNEPQEEDLK
ncbi:MAG: GLUG motif-containing protein [Ruminococcus sp.]